MEVNGAKQLFGSNHSSIIFLCVQQRKEIHTGLKQLEGELMMNDEFSFLGGVSL